MDNYNYLAKHANDEDDDYLTCYTNHNCRHHDPSNYVSQQPIICLCTLALLNHTYHETVYIHTRQQLCISVYMHTYTPKHYNSSNPLLFVFPNY